MKNERRLLPLRKFEVTYITSIDQRDVERTDSFTADMHRVEEGRNQFMSTGNVIREYQIPLIRIVVTPVDEE
jgi:monomeric isocitrate dehydrogenase